MKKNYIYDDIIILKKEGKIDNEHKKCTCDKRFYNYKNSYVI